MVDILTGVPSIVAGLFIYAAVGDDVQASSGSASPSAWRWCC